MRTHPDAAMRLDEQLCFALHAASRRMTAAYRPLLEQLKLTYPQYLVMLVLWEDRMPCTVSALGERLQLDSGTLTPLLKRLEHAGYVTRQRSHTDERVVLIALTSTGRAVRARAAPIPSYMAARLRMPGEHVERLRDELKSLAAHLAPTASPIPPGDCL